MGAGSAEATFLCADGQDLQRLLASDISPQDVAVQYFKACCEDNPMLWLATLHIDARSVVSSARCGPYRTCQWEEGRARVEKYKTEYKYLGQANGGMSKASNEPYVTLKYLPLYGPVPGYQEGKPLGAEISLVLRQQGGVGGQWRVAEGGF